MPAAIPIAAVAVSAAASMASSAMQAGAAKDAANTQANAANRAADMQQDQYGQTRQDLLPYMQAGESVLPTLPNYTGAAQGQLSDYWNTIQSKIPGPMTEDQLVQTPGYQFALSQGLKSVQNNAAARGLGVSGAALTGAAKFATGLADQTYQDQFNQQQAILSDYNQQFSNLLNTTNQGYNQLMGVANLGENAAARSGAIGQQGAASAGTNIAGAGIAQAAGISAGATALSGGLQKVGNAGLDYMGAQKYFNQNLSGGNGSYGVPAARTAPTSDQWTDGMSMPTS